MSKTKIQQNIQWSPWFNALWQLWVFVPVLMLVGCHSTTVYWSSIQPGQDGQERGPHFLMRWSEGDDKPETILCTTAKGTNWKPLGIALDAARNQIYWAEPDSNRIMVADLDKREPSQFPEPGATVQYPGYLAIDFKTNRLFWSAMAIGRPAEPKIQYAYLSGPDRTVHDFALGIPTPVGITIDQEHRRLFWVTRGVRGERKQFGVLQSKSLDEQDPHVPPHSFNEIPEAMFQETQALAMYPKNGMLMWVNEGFGSIQSAIIEKDRATWWGPLATGLPVKANSVASDNRGNSSAIYWGNRVTANARIYRGEGGLKNFSPIFNIETHAADIQVTHDPRLRSKQPTAGR